MELVEKLPSAFDRYRAMMGVLDFVVFEDAAGTEEEVLLAVPKALRQVCTVDIERLRSLGYRLIDERTFFGDWYDFESGNLLKLGRFTTSEGAELQNPILKNLDRVTIMSGGWPIPVAGVGGQFAYAFTQPPYHLKARPSEVQTVFEGIRQFILPSRHDTQIFDWTSPHLPEVSDYYESGMEWWGVFLFSIYVPQIRRLTIIAGSTTD